MLSEEYPEWKALLTEVLAAIAKRLTSIADYSSFRGVCSSWRCAATFDNFDRKFPRAPRLLYFVKEIEEETHVLDAGKTEEETTDLSEVSEEEEVEEEIHVLDAGKTEEREEETTDFYEVSEEEEEETHVLDTGKTEETTDLSEVSDETPIHEKIVANFLDLESNTSKIDKFPPQSPYKYLSCSGWILASNQINFSDEIEFSLKHFMLGINIKLPLWDVFISKMVLSGSPMEESGVVVMVIWGYDDELAFCRPGDECWTLIDSGDGCFCDIIYHNRKLYALDDWLSIVECDIHGSNPTKIVEVFAIPRDDIKFRFSEERFLVQSFGKFLIVLQYVSRNEGYYYFRIFEIELKDGSYEEIDNIGDGCLFLGFNSSICVASSRVEALKPNCIYFSKNKGYGPEPHVGVFYRLGDGGGGYFENFSSRFDFCYPLPLWVVPSI